MSSSIFLIGRDEQLTELRQTGYDSEEFLQRLLADHPSILGLSTSGGGRLLLIQREFGVPESDESSGRWSLDHLFVDQDGVPILVEVKRATDTRARREVVAQMLDYAANVVAYWPIERVTRAYADCVTASGRDPETTLAEFLGELQPEAFWRQVDANLRAGRIRMVFVADRIAPELRRIVEFLNEQMRPAEVLAVEVEQFVGQDGERTLVPGLLGDTQRARVTKAVRDVPLRISEREWLDTFDPALRPLAESVSNWFVANGFQSGISDSQDSRYFFVFRSRTDGWHGHSFSAAAREGWKHRCRI